MDKTSNISIKQTPPTSPKASISLIEEEQVDDNGLSQA